MASNLRGSHVVAPGHVAEYDRIAGSSPLAVMVGGVALWVVGSLAAIFARPGDGPLVVLLLLSLAAGAAGVWGGTRLGIRNAERRKDITRDVSYLRSVVLFDEDAVSDENVWAAAEIAADLEELDEDTDRLASARIRTAEQDAELVERESRMHEMTQRISALVG